MKKEQMAKNVLKFSDKIITKTSSATRTLVQKVFECVLWTSSTFSLLSVIKKTRMGNDTGY